MPKTVEFKGQIMQWEEFIACCCKCNAIGTMIVI